MRARAKAGRHRGRPRASPHPVPPLRGMWHSLRRRMASPPHRCQFPRLYHGLPSFNHHEPVTLAGKGIEGRAIGAQAPKRLPIELAEAGSNLFLVAGNSSRGRAPDSMFFKRSKVDKKMAAETAAEPASSPSEIAEVAQAPAAPPHAPTEHVEPSLPRGAHMTSSGATDPASLGFKT